MFRRTAAAFTLIELLVVIAIISVLAAILFPVFAQAREKARQSACLSNMKQIGLAMMQYTQDYDETFSQAEYLTTGTGNVPRNEKWMDVLQPYVKSTAIFACPSDPLEGAHWVFGRNGEYVYPPTERSTQWGSFPYGSYGFNYSYFDEGDPYSPPIGRGLSAIAVPAATVLFAEVHGIGGYGDIFWSGVAESPATIGVKDGLRILPHANNSMWGGVAERHNGVCNVLWADGHVKGHKLEYLAERHTVNGQSVLFRFTIEED